MIQYIIDGYNTKNERVVLWRTNDYMYELEIGTGLYKKSQNIQVEYYDAIELFKQALKA